MTPSFYFSASASGRNVSLLAKNCGGLVAVHGGTVPVSARLGDAVEEVIITLPEGQCRGIVAVSCGMWTGEHDYSWRGLLLAVEEHDGRAYIVLDHPYVPPLVHAFPQFSGPYFEVVWRGGGEDHNVRYTTNEYNAKYHGMRLVRDSHGGLLVRLLEDPEAIEDVRKAAADVESEQSEVERLTRELAEMGCRLVHTEVERDKFETNLLKLQGAVRLLYAMLFRKLYRPFGCRRLAMEYLEGMEANGLVSDLLLENNVVAALDPGPM